MENGNHEAAIQCFTNAMALDDDISRLMSPYRMARAQAFLQVEDFSAAIADFDELIKHSIHFDLALVLRGETYLRIGNVEQAIADSSEAIRSMAERYNGVTHDIQEVFDTLLRQSHYCRGVAYEQKEEWDRAIADYTEVIRIDPNCAPVYGSRGRLYLFEKDEIEKAVVDFTNVIRISPDNGLAHAIRGLAHRVLGKEKEATADFARAKQLGVKTLEGLE